MSDRRVTLVLGAGGVTGGSFHAGVLAALAEGGWDPARADLIVGTSAGAISGSMLRAGVPAVDLFARATGRAFSPAGQRLLSGLGGPLRPPRPGRLRRPGTPDSNMIGHLVDGITGDAWPDDPLWIVAVKARTGRRAVFGRDGETVTTPGSAVAASAAVPGLFRPVSIGGSPHVDGAVRSVHSLDLVADHPSDLVLVSAPMAHDGSRQSLGIGTPLAAWVRAQLLHEARRAQRAGRRVEIIAPDRGVRDVMGADAMDPSRRRTVAEYVYDWMRSRVRAGSVPGLELLV